MKWLVSILMIMISAAAHAESFKIAAIVNDDIISNIDLQNRVNLVIHTTALKDTPETREKLKSQVLVALIDERLKKQEAQRSSISATESDLNTAIANLERQQKSEESKDIRTFLKSRGIPFSSFQDQLESQIIWNKIVRSNIARNVTVLESEVKRAQRQIVNSVQEEVNIASLTLPVATPEDELKVQQFAESLARQAEDAQRFDALARQLGSSGQSSVRSGWVAEGRLDPIYKRVLRSMEAGQVSEPLRTPNGYEILLYQGRRERPSIADAELVVKQIQLSLEQEAAKEEVEILMSIAKDVARNPGTCFDETVSGVESLEGMNISVDFYRAKQSEMAPPIQRLVGALNVGQVTPPFATPTGIQLMTVCERLELPPELPDPAKVRQVLFEEKVQLEAQKYLRDLRRNAFIDRRELSL